MIPPRFGHADGSPTAAAATAARERARAERGAAQQRRNEALAAAAAAQAAAERCGGAAAEEAALQAALATWQRRLVRACRGFQIRASGPLERAGRRGLLARISGQLGHAHI